MFDVKNDALSQKKLSFDYGDGTLTGSQVTYPGSNFQTNELGLDKTFNVTDNIDVNVKGDLSNLKMDGSTLYTDKSLTPTVTYNKNIGDGSLSLSGSKEIMDGGVKPNIGLNFSYPTSDTSKIGLTTNNLLSEDPTGNLSFTKNIGNYGDNTFLDASVELDPFNTDQYTGMLKFQKKFADGGRVGLFMGGPPLEGQALNIYNSMNSYGFTDQQIADALQGQGLYTPAGGGGGGGGNEQVTGIIGTQLNRGDDSVTSIAPGTLQKQYEAQLKNPINNALYEMGAKFKASQPYQKTMNLGAMAIGALSGIPGLGFLLDKLGQPGFNRGNIREMNTPKTLDATKFSDTSGINTDFGGVTVDDLGRIVQTGDYLTAENVMAGYNTGFDLTGTAFDRIDKITSKGPLSDYNRRKIKALKDFAAASAKSRKDALQAEIERAQRIKDEAARSAAVERARVKSISEGYGGADDSPGATGPTAVGAGMGVGGGYATDFGYDFKDGGLATMFVEKR